MTDDKKNEVGFGPKFIGNTTPAWAKWFFRIFFYVTSMATLGITVFSELSPATKLVINEAVTFANICAHGFTKMFGFKVDDTDYSK